ncbi:MAG: hypothetical protein ACXWWW_08720 [Candidatus Deferrimicrobiaceae bacterium]
MSPTRWGRTSPARFDAFWRRFLLSWLAVSGLGTLFLFLVLYQFFSSPLTGGYRSAFYTLRHLAESLTSVVALSMLAYVLLVGGAAGLLCISLLYKIAGPIYGLEKALESCLDGEPIKPFFVRHGDLVPELGGAFNGFVGRLREDRQRWIRMLENADRLCLQDRVTCRAEREKALADLEILLSRYR